MRVVKQYRFLTEDVDRHGNVRLYFRRRGFTKVRIRAALGSKEFELAYADALEASQSGRADVARAAAPLPNSWRWLCHRYFQSVEFKQLDANSTQRIRRQILESTWIEPVAPDSPLLIGDCPTDRFNAKIVRVLRDRKANFPDAANNRLKAVRRLLTWAVEQELVTSNPARDVPRLRTSAEGFHAWSLEEIARFEARWPIGTKERLAFALFRYLGVRRSDAVRLGKQHIREREGKSYIRFTAEKGKRQSPVTLELPVPPVLGAIINDSPTGDLAFLVTEYGRPFAAAGFGNWFRERCSDAGLPQCSAHGLRKFAATELAEAGASPHQLMACFGWKSLKEAERYTRSANQRKLAEDAQQLVGRGR